MTGTVPPPVSSNTSKRELNTTMTLLQSAEFTCAGKVEKQPPNKTKTKMERNDEKGNVLGANHEYGGERVYDISTHTATEHTHARTL